MEHEDTVMEETAQLLPSPTPRTPRISSSVRTCSIPLTTALLTALGISVWLLGQQVWSAPSVPIQGETEILFKASCVADWMNCSMSGCCTSKGHSCYKLSKNWATCEPHTVELTRGKNEKQVSCTWTGSNCTDTKCCNDDSSRCYKHNETYAECELKKVLLLPGDVKFEGANEYEIIYTGNLNVREAKDLNSDILDHKTKGDIVLGHPDGDWVKLVGEPGYIVTSVNGKSTMKLHESKKEGKVAEGKKETKVEDKKETKTEHKKDTKTKAEDQKKDTKKAQDKKETEKTADKKEAKKVEDKKETKKVEDKKETKKVEDKKETKKIDDKGTTKVTEKAEDEKETKKANDKKETEKTEDEKETEKAEDKKEAKKVEDKKDTKKAGDKKETDKEETKEKDGAKEKKEKGGAGSEQESKDEN